MAWWSRRGEPILPILATKTAGEVIKTAVTAAAAATVAGPAVALMIGTVSKDLIETLFARASAVEKKLDRLMFEPFMTGLRLLKEGLSQRPNSETERQAVDNLLFQSHVAFTKALTLYSDSREDSLLIRGLDSIALAAHSGYRKLAGQKLSAMRGDLDSVRAHVAALRAAAAELSRTSEDLDNFLVGDDPWRDKPYGYGEQRGLAREIRAKAKGLNARAEEAGGRCEILEGLVLIAECLREAQSE